MADAKAKVDVGDGLIELEGDVQFVSTYLDKLLPLVESSDFGYRFRQAESEAAHDVVGRNAETESRKDTAEELQEKKKRKTPKRPPAGASCRDRIATLKADSFFRERRSPIDIVSGLAEKGWTHKSNQVSAALTTMFNNGEIQRTKAADGPGFTYFWDR